MSKGHSNGTTDNASTKNPVERYYTEGVIKELWIKSAKEVCFTVMPDSEYSVEVEHKGEKKTCAVFRPENFSERVFGGAVADLYAGEFTFSGLMCMTFDRLLRIKINGCHIRIYVVSKDPMMKYGGESKVPLQVSEIRLKQK
ncbi:MAG: hypothetical protein ACI4Q3_07800 [Kiritimatiellia bacterium]